MAITHAYVSAIADSGDATIVQPTDWNADHTIAAGSITVAMLANGIDGELITWDASGVAATVAVGTATHVLTSNGVGVAPTFQAIPAASVSLDGITAAAADQAGIANADWNIRWNWAKVTNSEDAFTFGESAAATGGTSTSGVPNQVLLKLATLAASTMSPLSVYSREAHVFSVSPTAAQILADNGSAATPIYSFAGRPLVGTYSASTGQFNVSVAGAEAMRVTAASILGAAAGSGASINFGVVGYAAGWWMASGLVGLSIGGDEVARFTVGGWQPSKGSDDAVSYAINARKSRGTVAAPTVITTGDDLLTLSGFGYVGGTGTYVEGCKILFDSTGTIANTTSGLGGIMRFMAAKVGTVGPLEIMRLTAGTTTGGGWATMNEADASPGTADLADGDEAAVYVKAGNIVFAQNVAGTINFLYAPLDGTTTLWTANTTGP